MDNFQITFQRMNLVAATVIWIAAKINENIDNIPKIAHLKLSKSRLFLL